MDLVELKSLIWEGGMVPLGKKHHDLTSPSKRRSGHMPAGGKKLGAM